MSMSNSHEALDSNGRALEGNPVQPDHRVSATAEDWAAGRDPVLEKALELLLAQIPAH